MTESKNILHVEWDCVDSCITIEFLIKGDDFAHLYVSSLHDLDLVEAYCFICKKYNIQKIYIENNVHGAMIADILRNNIPDKNIEIIALTYKNIESTVTRGIRM